MSKKIQLFGFVLGIIAFFAFLIAPTATKAGFFDDVVDFINPVERVKNVIDGNIEKNLFPPLPGINFDSSGRDSSGDNINVNISANPSQVPYNGSSVITWNSSNANYCYASGGTNGWSGNKSTAGTFYTGNLTSNTTFYITCINDNASANDSVTVYVDSQQNQTCQDTNAINYGGSLPCRYENNNQNVTVTLRADDTSIDFEDDTTIRWSSNDADYCRASGGDNGWSGNKNTSGSFNTGSLTDTTTYRITCYNGNDSADDSITIRVDDNNNDNNNGNEPDVTTRNATNINGDSATLNGRVDGNGSTVRAWFEYGTYNSLGYSTSRNSYSSSSRNFEKNISGLMPNTTYYFRAVAENSDDIVYGSILSFYTGNGFNNQVNNQPTVVISADSTNLASGGATNIRWYTTDVTSCYASGGSAGWAGVKNIGSGSFYTGPLTSSRTFVLTCSNNFGSSADSVTVNVRGQVLGTSTTRTAPPTSLVLLNSSLNSNQPVMATLDNSSPRAGDEINYTLVYQNVGTGSITDATLQINLPQEVSYMSSSPSNPNIFGNTLIFSLGTLRANSQGVVRIRVFVKNNVLAGTNLNFPATLSYIDPSGMPQSISTNAFAQVWGESRVTNDTSLGANVFGAGFLPTNLLGWLLLITLVLLLILIARYLFIPNQSFSFNKTIDPHI